MTATPETHDKSRRRRAKAIVALAAAAGFLMATDVALASNWTVGLANGSSGEGQSGTVSNLTITASTAASPTNLLFPGNQGDVVVTINNPNNYPVQLTALQLPSNATGAAGYSNSNLQATYLEASCTGVTSGVTWTDSTVTPGASQTLSTPLVVGASGSANDPLVVTLTNYATMASTSPSACEGSWFSMPSLSGVTASVSNATPTTSPAVDS